MTETKGTFEERLQDVQSGMKTLNQLDEELKGMNRRLTVLKDGKEEDLPGGENDEDL